MSLHETWVRGEKKKKRAETSGLFPFAIEKKKNKNTKQETKCAARNHLFFNCNGFLFGKKGKCKNCNSRFLVSFTIYQPITVLYNLSDSLLVRQFYLPMCNYVPNTYHHERRHIENMQNLRIKNIYYPMYLSNPYLLFCVGN
jgi:hypothetical protein